jgi:hypothetical protein
MNYHNTGTGGAGNPEITEDSGFGNVALEETFNIRTYTNPTYY